MYNSGARLSEMTYMRRGQVKFDSTTCLELHGKGRKERVIPLWIKTGRVLRNWFRELEPKATEVAFPSVRGTPLSSDGLDYILQQAVKRATEACPSLLTKRVTPHLIRHYLPFLTMSGTGTPAQYFRQMREVAHDIVLTPSISPMQGKGVHREVYYRLPSSSFASARRPSRVTYRAVCEVTE